MPEQHATAGFRDGAPPPSSEGTTVRYVFSANSAGHPPIVGETAAAAAARAARTCADCRNRVFPTRTNYLRHRREKHEESPKKHEYPRCHKDFTRRFYQQAHTRTCTQGRGDRTTGRLLARSEI